LFSSAILKWALKENVVFLTQKSFCVRKTTFSCSTAQISYNFVLKPRQFFVASSNYLQHQGLEWWRWPAWLTKKFICMW
jgi:hypothetical protein